MNKLVWFTILSSIVFAGCASRPKSSPTTAIFDRENAIFLCKQNLQTKKKAHFQTLPTLLKRMAGDNQVLREQTHPLTKKEIRQAIAKFPLSGDSGGTWRLKKDAHLRTVTARFELPSATEKDPTPKELVSLIFGQPGRVYSFPIEKLKSTQASIKGSSQDDTLEIKVMDEHHVLINATTLTPKAAGQEPARPPATLFYPSPVYALVRTYVEQDYDNETATRLSDYPVYDARLTEDVCE